MTSGILVRLGSSGTTYAGCAEFKEVGGRACKPDSVLHPNCVAVRVRGDHSSSPGIATGIQQPTRGFYRAGPALPSYLALHHAGFSVPPVLPPERWALTPPFHPCQTSRAFRRRLTGFPVRCHRASLRRRSILCGTFRSASSGTGIPACPPGFAPWRYQARCPVKSSADHSSAAFRRPRTDQRASGRCPDFPPAQPSCDDQASDHPARRHLYYTSATPPSGASELVNVSVAIEGNVPFGTFAITKPLPYAW